MRDYLVEMLDALTSAYSRKDHDNLREPAPVETLIGKLFSVLAWGLNTVQEHAELIKLWDDIDNAHGSVLDRYGANFGVKRFGAGDAFYRLAIKVKLLSQLSGGDIDTVLNAAASLFEIPVERIDMDEVFPDKIQLNVNEADLTPETLEIVVDIVTMIKRILAAGIGIITVLQSYREFKSDVLIETALFDHTELTFDLPDVRRAFTEPVQLGVAAFERTSLTFGFPGQISRTFSQTVPVDAVLFERTQLRVEPVAARPQVFRSTSASAFVLFEYSRVNITSCY